MSVRAGYVRAYLSTHGVNGFHDGGHLDVALLPDGSVPQHLFLAGTGTSTRFRPVTPGEDIPTLRRVGTVLTHHERDPSGDTERFAHPTVHGITHVYVQDPAIPA